MLPPAVAPGRISSLPHPPCFVKVAPGDFPHPQSQPRCPASIRLAPSDPGSGRSLSLHCPSEHHNSVSATGLFQGLRPHTCSAGHPVASTCTASLNLPHLQTASHHKPSPRPPALDPPLWSELDNQGSCSCLGAEARSCGTTPQSGRHCCQVAPHPAGLSPEHTLTTRHPPHCILVYLLLAARISPP